MRTLYFSLILMTFSQSLFAENCLKVRAAFDIGSGATKMKVAQVDSCKHKIVKVLLQEDRAIGYKQDLQQNKSDNLSEKVLQEGLKAMQELKDLATKQKATEFRAVATSAFRTAKNSQVAVKLFKEKLGIEVSVIDQQEEARLGYYGGVAHAKSSTIEDIVVWDIGGGSMQIVGRDNSKRLVIYGGKLASVSFKNKIIGEMQKKDVNKVTSPNPIGKKNAGIALKAAKDFALKDIPEFFKKKFKNKKTEIIGIGGVHYYSIRNQLKKPQSFTAADILAELKSKMYMDDKAIGGDYASTEAANLILVSGIMQALQIDKVIPVKVNLADGLLLQP